MMHNQEKLSDNQLVEMMYGAGVRPSLHRLAVLGYIASSGTHPSADKIYADIAANYPNISRTTIYNSLHILTDAGLIKELEIESGNKHYDFAPQPEHSHFLCRRCGKIFDMDLPQGLCMSSAPGFRTDSIEVYFKGICPKCMK